MTLTASKAWHGNIIQLHFSLRLIYIANKKPLNILAHDYISNNDAFEECSAFPCDAVYNRPNEEESSRMYIHYAMFIQRLNRAVWRKNLIILR